MKEGSILASSIYLLKEIILEEKKTSLVIKKYFRQNRFIGSKDKNAIKNLIYKFLKNFYSLKNICKENNIKFNVRNGLLLLFLNNNKNQNFCFIYDGKYSLKKKISDKKIFEIIKTKNFIIKPDLPKWLKEKLNKQTQKIFDKISLSVLKEGKFDIRVNSNSCSREQLLKKIRLKYISAHPTKFSSLGITFEKKGNIKILEKYYKGLFEIQDEGSQVTTILSEIKPGLKILDYCAGKGTKTLAIRDLMKSEGELYAYDVDEQRLSFFEDRLKKLKIKDINILNSIDGFDNYFDLIILDVPCSGSGIWRRRPEELVRLNEKKLSNLVEVQKKILEKAKKLCKIRGRISYITCSLIKNENEDQINNFLRNNLDFRLNNLKNNFKKEIGKNFLNLNYELLTITPDLLYTDGYFISIMEKYA